MEAVRAWLEPCPGWGQGLRRATWRVRPAADARRPGPPGGSRVPTERRSLVALDHLGLTLHQAGCLDRSPGCGGRFPIYRWAKPRPVRTPLRPEAGPPGPSGLVGRVLETPWTVDPWRLPKGLSPPSWAACAAPLAVSKCAPSALGSKAPSSKPELTAGLFLLGQAHLRVIVATKMTSLSQRKNKGKKRTGWLKTTQHTLFHQAGKSKIQVLADLGPVRANLLVCRGPSSCIPTWWRRRICLLLIVQGLQPH